MSDPEIDAMSAVAAAVDSLDAEVQRRVLRWAGDRYGITGALDHSGRVNGGEAGEGRGTGGAGDEIGAVSVDEGAVMKAVGEETGVAIEKLERVFHIDDGSVKLLGSSSKYGSTTTAQARAVAQIVTVFRRVGMGDLDTSLEVIKDACESKHCYDQKNFASHHLGKLEGFVVKGEKKTLRLEAKGSGIAAFGAVIDKVPGGA